MTRGKSIFAALRKSASRMGRCGSLLATSRGIVDAHEGVIVNLARRSFAILLERDRRCLGHPSRLKARHVTGDASLVAARRAVLLVLLVGHLQDEIFAFDDLAVAVASS